MVLNLCTLPDTLLEHSSYVDRISKHKSYLTSSQIHFVSQRNGYEDNKRDEESGKNFKPKWQPTGRANKCEPRFIVLILVAIVEINKALLDSESTNCWETKQSCWEMTENRTAICKKTALTNENIFEEGQLNANKITA